METLLYYKGMKFKIYSESCSLQNKRVKFKMYFALIKELTGK